MNKGEFTQFFDRARATFPALDRYFSIDRIEPTEAAQVLSTWQVSLENVALDLAMGAIAAMVSCDLEAPKFLDDWARLPGIIRRWSRDHKPPQAPSAKFTEHRGCKCFTCRDQGFGVEVFNTEWLWVHARKIERGELGDNWHREAARWCIDNSAGPFMYSVHCCCEAGDQQAAKLRQEVARFNPEHECLVPTPRGGPDDWLRAITAFVKSTSPPEPQEWRSKTPGSTSSGRVGGRS